jgi:hypothetical protein
VVYWLLLANILVQLLVMPLLLAVKVIQPGFWRFY